MDQVFNAVKKKNQHECMHTGCVLPYRGSFSPGKSAAVVIICEIKLLRGFFCCSHSSGTSRSFTDVMLVCTSVFVWT